MYIEQEIVKLKDGLINTQRRTDHNINVLLKKIEKLQAEIEELKSGR
jgi:hypothetical protein